MRSLGYLALGTGVLGLGASEYFRREFGEEALPRLLTAYSVAIPGFFAYKRVQFTYEKLPVLLGREADAAAAAREYMRLHAVWAPRGLEVILKLRGFNLKTGQLVAGNFGNVFPTEWQNTFECLLDAVPHKPFAEVRRTIEAEYGKPLEAVFKTFAQEPMAAASIGQVHRATLHSGEAVVVKVMYREVEGQFRGDIFAAKKFAAVALPEHVKALCVVGVVGCWGGGGGGAAALPQSLPPWLPTSTLTPPPHTHTHTAPREEIEKQFANEFDYRREAAQLELIRGNLARAGSSFANFDIPRPFMALCTKAVLVMTEIPACAKLTTALDEDIGFFAQRRGISKAELVAEERALNDAALARGELRCGPTSATMDSWIQQLRWSNWLRGWVGGAPSHVPLNHAHLMDELLRVHGHEVLVDGAFNGDPHPGNVLVSRPRGSAAPPRLALVDYGQVKVLTAHERLQVARLMAAHARADPTCRAHRARVCSLMQDMGFSGERGDVDVGYELSRLFFDRDDLLTTGGKNTQAYIESLQARDATRTIGDNFVLVARCSLMLRGLGHQLNQHRSAAKAWQPLADAVMRQAGEDPERILA